jgi:hypothetical protein
MIKPQFNAKMYQSLEIDEWQREDQILASNLGIKGKIMRKDVSLKIIEALMHDALLYQEIYDANFHSEGMICELDSVTNSDLEKIQQPIISLI